MCSISTDFVPFFWGKTEKEKKDRYHSLLLHMLDVAAVAGRIWDEYLTPPVRKRVEQGLGLEDARPFIMFLAGAHDIGKANPAFQKRKPEYHGLDDSWFSRNDVPRPHGHVSAKVLGRFLPVSLWGRVAGGHHGVFPRAEVLQNIASGTLGDDRWNQARQALLTQLACIVGLHLDEVENTQSEVSDPGLVPLLAGFVSVADWIGSDENLFPLAMEVGKSRQIDLGAYWTETQESARKALEQLGWLPAVKFACETSFRGVFPEYKPNSVQSVVAELALRQKSPYLMIVEAPTGLGKTEAALYAADLAMCRGFARGMYVAMPTQATGNKMFVRVHEEYLSKRGHQGRLNLQLVHGNAVLVDLCKPKNGNTPEPQPRNIEDDAENESGDLEAQSWFTARKRPLLAPFGVGTIDQSLLSVLQTRHWFVRMTGLAGKVVIFDEVHAYDTYMTTILERLLHWLAELDCTVIMLSATLPDGRRKKLVQAYSGRDDADYCPYPRITLALPRHHPKEQAGMKPVCVEVPKEGSRRVALRFQNTDLALLAGRLKDELQHGGCAAVVCNTVDRSIETYDYLCRELRDTECFLFHARTLQKWRHEREEEVEHKFGKGKKQPDGTCVNPDRPFRSVLVATQVIEQSLDLDFDLMFSEIAPVDLLLQRAGRMHRHLRVRPQGLETPCFTVLCDAEVSGPPPDSFGNGIEYVYDRYILLRTWLVLRQRREINIPDEVETLIEAVYGPNALPAEDGWSEALCKAEGQMKDRNSESENSAKWLLVAFPQDPSELVEQFNAQLTEDEDPEVHKAVRAATREGDPSVTAVLLPAGEHLSKSPNRTEVCRLLGNSVSLNHRGVFGVLRNDSPATEWQESVHLRHCRLVRLDENGKARVGNYILTVDKQRGIVINKEEQTNG